MKIYRRMRTWIMVAVLIIITVLASVIMYNAQSSFDQTGWQVETQHRIESNKMALDSPMPQAAKEMIKDSITVDEYALAHDIPPSGNTLWGAVKNLSTIIVLITILTVIVAGDSVAGEFSTGTIKLLLIRPASRSKVLLSKYIAAFVFALFLLAVLFASSFITNSILLGWGDINLPYLHVGSSGQVVEGLLVTQVLQTYALNCVQLIMIVTMAFMISTVFRSSSLSIGLSIFILFVGSNITFFLAKYEWVKYFLFANTDLTQHIEGRPLVEGMTMQSSIAVLIVYFIIFNLLSWGIFKKRDVAA